MTETLDPASEERAHEVGAVGERIHFSDLKIRTKERGLVPFVPNEIQKRFLDELSPGWFPLDKPDPINAMRENILKARQFGFSTLLLALFFLDTLSRPNTYSVVVAHDADSTERLFQVITTFYDNLPTHKKPRTKYANRREYVWPDLNSSFFVGQAGSRDFGRSSTINNLLATEVAFWPDPERLFSALLGAVPASGNAVIESTANGFGSWHQKEYERSKTGASSLGAHFYAWHEHAEYATAPAPGFDEVTRNLDGEERRYEEMLVERYGLTRAQLQWRRNKMREPGMETKFAQEFPANDEEAFLNSGRSAFRGAWVLRQAQFDSPSLPQDELPASIRSAFGMALDDLVVYQKPVKGRHYVLGGDVAEGLEKGDYSPLVVLDRETLEECACYHGKPEPDTLGIYADALARWFNNALAGIERNNHGFTTLTKMKELGTPNVYEFEDNRRGWLTNLKTKPQIVDDLGVALRDELIQVRSAKARNEMRAFAVKSNGSYGAPAGENDDLVMAWAVALRMAKEPISERRSSGSFSFTTF